MEISPPVGVSHAWHGWWDKGRVPIDPTDIAALFVTLQARLAVDEQKQPDERARLLLWTSIDYYINGKTIWTVPNPAAVASRSKRITLEWKAFNALTFSNVAIQEPGGGIPEAESRCAAPPRAAGRMRRRSVHKPARRPIAAAALAALHRTGSRPPRSDA